MPNFFNRIRHSLYGSLIRWVSGKLIGVFFILIAFVIYHFFFVQPRATPDEVATAVIERTGTPTPVVADSTYGKLCIHLSEHLSDEDQRVMSIARPFIQQHEGLRLTVYQDRGNPTIGYGHHLTGIYNDVKSIDRETAECFLNEDMREITDFMDATLPNNLNVNQKAALMSWIYNVGPGAARRSTLFEEVQDNRLKHVPTELRRWVHTGKAISPVLTQRREDEIQLFESPVK